MIDLLRIVLVLMIISIISVIPQAFGQISLGVPAEHVSNKITIGENGEVHVVHVVKKSDKNIQVTLIPGRAENIEVKDGNNNQLQYARSGNSIVTLFPPEVNIGVEYDLKDVLILKNGVWTWNFLYTQGESTKFFFPDNVDLVFANDRPVHINDAEGMRCHGCQMNLEYIINEPTILNEVEWGENKFLVLIRTLDKIDSFSFDQPSKSISFEVTKGGDFVTLVIPLELLWNPYEVYFEDEKILKHEFSQNSTHVWLNIRPESPGTIEIIGVSAIPEFSILIPLVFGFTIVIGLQIKNKINPH
jgi:hypothetical protein